MSLQQTPQEASAPPSALAHPASPYVVPMAGLLFLLALGEHFGLGPWEYPLRVGLLTGLLLLVARRQVDLRVVSWWQSLLIGAAVFVIWIAPETLWPGYRHLWLFDNALTGSAVSSVPEDWRTSPMVLIFRTVRSVVLVPIIEELFWRAWLMRWLINADFRRVPLGAYTPYAFWVSAALFATVHGSYWDVGLIAGVVYNWWMVRTKSLGDCILAHAVTNALLSGYVVTQGHWQYW